MNDSIISPNSSVLFQVTLKHYKFQVYSINDHLFYKKLFSIATSYLGINDPYLKAIRLNQSYLAEQAELGHLYYLL